MQAYEFLARPENGFIPIPENLRNGITSNVKVIVLEVKQGKVDDAVGVEKKSSIILPPSLDTCGWNFNREEANER